MLQNGPVTMNNNPSKPGLHTQYTPRLSTWLHGLGLQLVTSKLQNGPETMKGYKVRYKISTVHKWQEMGNENCDMQGHTQILMGIAIIMCRYAFAGDLPL